MSFESVISRLAELRSSVGPDSLKMRTALIRIGSTLRAQMVMNAPIKTGNLRNRINYVYRKLGDGAELQVGSYATPYAAVVEFGFNGIQAVREHKRRTPSGGMATVRAHPRRVDRKGRRYIRNALDKHAQFIIDQIRTIGEP